MSGGLADVVGVFGANGFIGRHLVRRLHAQGIRCIAFGRSLPYNYATSVAPVEQRTIDLDQILETHAMLQGVTHVVQLINSSGPALGNQRLCFDLSSNVLPHVGFIESCVMAGVRSFIFISSGGTVYGLPHALPIPETHPTEPLNSYGMTKLVVEQYLRLLTRETEMGFTVLRVSNPFGPGQEVKRGQGLVAAVLRQHAEGAPITIFGDGRAERDYLYIDDLIDAIGGALARPAVGKTLNIGSSIGRSVLDVISAMEVVLGQSIARVFAEGRATDTPSNILDIGLARDHLGWTPATSFHEGLLRTISDWMTPTRS